MKINKKCENVSIPICKIQYKKGFYSKKSEKFNVFL